MKKLAIDIIKALYDNGNITFEEALTLSENLKNNESNTNEDDIKYLNPINENNILTIDKLCEIYYNQVLESFNVKECVELMHRTNWIWHDVDEINEKTFKDFLKKQIVLIVNEILKYISNNENIDFDKEFGVDCGGFELYAFFNDIGNIELHVNFIATYGIAGDDVVLEDIKKLAKNYKNK